MCECPKDKAAPTKNDANETSPQTQDGGPPDRRPKQGCCRRVLTYEDEANVTVTELPISIPEPSQIAGVAIVRRRIDFGTSPDRKEETSKKADESATSEDKSDEQQQPKDSEKEAEGESPADETLKEVDKTEQQPTPTNNAVTSTPCPGQLNANNDCNCSPIPKT